MSSKYLRTHGCDSPKGCICFWWTTEMKEEQSRALQKCRNQHILPKNTIVEISPNFQVCTNHSFLTPPTCGDISSRWMFLLECCKMSTIRMRKSNQPHTRGWWRWALQVDYGNTRLFISTLPATRVIPSSSHTSNLLLRRKRLLKGTLVVLWCRV